ncbi:hypothetical protein [Octadecabacter sp. R77987]|uniref:hypothetical protein n=1 Tax=Octadecabacter sp. R77987 TaxID=3093874 RepID=UPI00366F8E14
MAQAEQYGTLSFGFGSADITDNGSPEGTGTGIALQGFVGFQADNGMRYELDYGVRSESGDGGYDGLFSSRMIALRAARAFGAIEAEGIIGQVFEEAGDGTATRQFALVGGTYDVSPQIYVQGALGYLSPDENGSDGNDAVRDLTTFSISGGYDISDRLNVELGYTYGEGIMDGDDDPATIQSASLGVRYDLNIDGMSVYGRYIAGDYYQGGEDDTAIEQRIELGVTMAFGGDGAARNARRIDIPRYDDWMAVTGSVIE